MFDPIFFGLGNNLRLHGLGGRRQRRLHNLSSGGKHVTRCTLRCCPHRRWTQPYRSRTTALAPRAGCMGFFELGPCLQAAALMPLLDACIESLAPCLQFESNWSEISHVVTQAIVWLLSGTNCISSLQGLDGRHPFPHRCVRVDSVSV